MKTILLIEDDAWLAQLYQDILSPIPDLMVRCSETADRALEILDTHHIDLIVLDMFLPGHNGIEFLHELASYSDTNTIPVIILSAVDESDFAMPKDRWQHYGVVEYLYKPQMKPEALRAALKKQLLAKGQVV